MTPQGIYNNLLLPEIIDFCQSFFPSIIELSCNNCLSDLKSTSQEINTISQTLQQELVQSLSLSALEATTQNQALNAQVTCTTTIAERIAQLNNNLSVITGLSITHGSNPLAPLQLINIAGQAINAGYGYIPKILQNDMEKQFSLLAEGFYRKLNALFTPYVQSYSSIVAAAPTGQATQEDHATKSSHPHTHTGSNNTASQSKALSSYFNDQELPGALTKHFKTLSLEQATAAIEQTKDFFDKELPTQIIGQRIHNLCKKIYIPAINYSLSRPSAFSEESSSAFKRLLLNLKTIGVYHRTSVAAQHSQALAATTEIIVNRFIKYAMEGEIDLTRAIEEISPLAYECRLPTLNIKAPNSTFIEQPAQKNPPPSQIKATLPTAQTQAKQIISTIMADNDPINSVAAKLKREWVSVLEAIGNADGTHSASWMQAVECFIDLLDFDNVHQLPIELANTVRGHLRTAQLNTLLTSEPAEQSMHKALKPIVQHTNKISFREGMWFDYNDGTVTLRCKLVAIIKQIGRYIFVSRQGRKMLELSYEQLQEKLSNNELSPCRDVSINSSLEDVLTSIKSNSTLTI